MSVHDWTRVGAGIFHAFHHNWISTIAYALNHDLLPPDYYALPEQHAAGFGPDVLTLQVENNEGQGVGESPASGPERAALLALPKLEPTSETDLAFYRRKQKVVAVRHRSGDRIVAMVEIVSPGSKAAQNALRGFVQKAAELLETGIHLLVIDLFPPGRRDPNGIHGEIWQEMSGQEYALGRENPLTLAAYESGLTLRAYVRHVAVGDTLVDMPLFLEPSFPVMLPLEGTYSAAFAEVPERWQRVLRGPKS
jgi:hypothetical protein